MNPGKLRGGARILLLCATIGWAAPAGAQTYTWTGGGSDDFFGTGANWGGTGPASATASVLVFAGTTGLAPTIEAGPSAYQVSSITFDATAGNFTIGNATASQALEFSGASGTNVITDNQIIPGTASGTAVTLGATYSETIAAPIYLNASTLTLNGTQQQHISGAGGSGNLTLASILFDSTNAAAATITDSTNLLTLGTASWTGATGSIALVATGTSHTSPTPSISSGALTFTGATYAGLASLTAQTLAGTLSIYATNASGFTTGATLIASSNNVFFYGPSAIAFTGNIEMNTISHRAWVFSDAGGVTLGSAGKTLNVGASAATYNATGTTASSFDVANGTTATIAANIVPTTAGGVAETLATGIQVNDSYDVSGFPITLGGTLILTGSNTYNGGTYLAGAGIIQVGNGGATGNLGTGGVTLTTATSFLKYDRSDTALADGNAISGSGGVSQIGGGAVTLSGANSYTGATTVSAGTLSYTGSNSSAASTTTVTHATLEGTGSLAGAVNIGDGTGVSGSGSAILAPGALVSGAHIGTLSLGATAIRSEGLLKISLDSGNPGSSDLLAVTGNFTIGSGALISLADLGSGGTLNSVYEIVSYTGTLSGTFANAANGSDLVIGANEYQIQYGGGEITLTDIAAVPEPKAAALLLAGLGALLFSRRRRAVPALA